MPLKFAGGVPLNVRVAESNVSQLGSAALPTSDAVSVRGALSGSVNAPGRDASKLRLLPTPDYHRVAQYRALIAAAAAAVRIGR